MSKAELIEKLRQSGVGWRMQRKMVEAAEATQEGIELQIRETQMEILKLDPECQEVHENDICIGSWDCEDSPIGVCVSNTFGDPACDHCLYCGGPDERK